MKKTLKIAALCMALCMAVTAFAACGGADTGNASVSEIYTALNEAVEFPEMLSLSEADLMSYLGIDSSLYTEKEAHIPLTAVSGDMVLIFKAADDAGVSAIREKLENYRSQKLAEMNNYLPDEYEKIGKSSVKTSGSIVWLVVSAEQEAAEAAVEGCLK